MADYFKIQENALISNMTHFVDRFIGVVFRYVFDESRNCFLVSYDIPLYLQDDDRFWDELYSFKSEFRERFADDAPIFMEGESICRISADAALIKFEDSSMYPDNSFVSKTFQNYTFPSEDNSVCFFDGYEEYLSAA